MPWIHQWSSDNGKWYIFSFATKFAKLNGVLNVVAQTVYVPTRAEYDNPNHPSNYHVPFSDVAIKRIPKYVRMQAEKLHRNLNAWYIETTVLVNKSVVYDQQQLEPGDRVERIGNWMATPDCPIARFMTPAGKILLLMDEVKLPYEQEEP